MPLRLDRRFIKGLRCISTKVLNGRELPSNANGQASRGHFFTYPVGRARALCTDKSPATLGVREPFREAITDLA